ncbi:MAG: DUF2071 domain-containing protein [Gemmatimonadetes bacterium]|nr:DUF2071 domain-containing protein [Gemmatimonadota bacterium]
MVDRNSIRSRPPGKPIMHQNWARLLFLHWEFPATLIRPLVPSALELDLYDGRAWVGVTPFALTGIRPNFAPPIPVLSDSLELNVRTYVHKDGVPGVWFLSLDASNPLAVWGARLGFHLPYYQARMDMEGEGSTIRFHSERTHPGADAASFAAAWSLGEPIAEAQPGTLDFFLIERYCLYAAQGGAISRARIHHEPWPLRRASIGSLSSTMLESHGLPAIRAVPLAHAQAAPLHVEIWAPEAA